MHTQSCFKISGKERRNLKKELGRVNSYIRNFWHYHQIDVDMCLFYSYKSDTYPMSNEKAESYFQELIVKANILTAQLNEINNL